MIQPKEIERFVASFLLDSKFMIGFLNDGMVTSDQLEELATVANEILNAKIKKGGEQ